MGVYLLQGFVATLYYHVINELFKSTALIFTAIFHVTIIYGLCLGLTRILQRCPYINIIVK